MGILVHLGKPPPMTISIYIYIYIIMLLLINMSLVVAINNQLIKYIYIYGYILIISIYLYIYMLLFHNTIIRFLNWALIHNCYTTNASGAKELLNYSQFPNHMLTEVCGPFGHHIWPMPMAALCFVNGCNASIICGCQHGPCAFPKKIAIDGAIDGRWQSSQHAKTFQNNSTMVKLFSYWRIVKGKDPAWKREVLKHKQWLP